MCGSELVTENFRTWFVESIHNFNGQEMTLRQFCRKVGMKEAAAIEQALFWFEKNKREFTGAPDQGCPVPLGVPDKPASRCTIWVAQ